MMLNNSARLINTVLCVLFIVVNGEFGVGVCTYLTKSRVASVAASEAKNLEILTFLGGNPTTSEILSDLVYVKNTL